MHITPDEPDAVPVERREDHPRQGQMHDHVWSLRDYAHQRCVARARDYRVAEPT